MELRKPLALLLTAGMALGLTVCGGVQDSGEGGETVSLTLWTCPVGAFADNLDEAIAAFNKVHPNIRITYEIIDYQNGDTRVASAIQGSSPRI